MKYEKKWQERGDDASSAFSISSLLDLDNSCKDMESVVSREFGPPHRPSSTINNKKRDNVRDETIFLLAEELKDRDEKSIIKKRKKKKRKRKILEMDETLVTHYSLRDVVQKGSKTTRAIGMASIFISLCVGSFAMSSLLLDIFQLEPVDTAPTFQSDIESDIESSTTKISSSDKTSSSDRFLQIKSELMKISNPKSLERKQSPQMRALDWIANHDEQELAVSAPNLYQRYALAVLFYSTGGENWKRDFNWLSGKHECHWKGEGGVRDCTNKWEVKDVALWNNLQGTIPSELFQMTKLETLYLARNGLEGSIPTEIGLLTNLEFAGLHHNRLTGTVPTVHMGNMLKLKTLHVERNALSGTIRRVDPLCQLRINMKQVDTTNKTLVGSLQGMTADCKVLVKWKKPAVACGCCTKCTL